MAGLKNKYIRLLPPLNITELQLRHFINEFTEIMDEKHYPAIMSSIMSSI
jgi:acetylornithine/succinyldiaminopimelate/putrescine aminotransferase